MDVIPKKKQLPYIGKHTPVVRVIEGKEVTDTTYHVVPEFAFTNQDNKVITQNDVEGKVYVVDFFFTSCPSICPVMTKQMKRVQEMLKNEKNFAIISFTVDPERDTPEKLKEYAEKFELDNSNWHLLTGDNEVIYDLGMNGYYLSMGKEDNSPGGFIHSPLFVLVDQKKNIRGMYDGTNAAEVGNLADDIKLLLAKQ